ncbi:MAG: DNA translocase FtsK 4TM domain-containing protein [Alphaproteobacteria bacterium]|nr:DNA translocase FtsK 4TM domain-containing protein [Alphaproteobacteria bacterium]
MAERAPQAFGISALCAGLILLIALLTFHASDPSLNNATDARALNALGNFGAALSDLGLQTLGLAAFTLAAPLIAWGAFSLWGARVRALWLRAALAPVASVLFAVTFAALPAPEAWPLRTGLGGLIGDIGLAGFSSLVSLGPGIPTSPLIAAMAGVGGFALIVYVAGWTWTGVGLWAHRLLTVAGAPLLAGWRVAKDAYDRRAEAAAERAYEEDDEAEEDEAKPTIWSRFQQFFTRHDEGEEEDPAPAVRKERPRREPVAADPAAGEENEDIADDSADTAAPAKRVTRTPVAVKEGKRAKAEAQATLDLVKEEVFELPPLAVLAKPKATGEVVRDSDDALEANARMLEQVLGDFGVRGVINAVRPGPVVTMYELEPAAGIKASRVIGLADDIARSMSAVSARVAVVPGRNVIGIELPNRRRETVYLRELLAANEYENTTSALALALGKDISGAPVFADLARMPHLLIAGTTGSGKSVGINTMILSLLYRLKPDQCRCIMIDPKMLELSIYEGIPHLLAPVVTEPKKAIVALKWAVREMEDRYRKMAKLGVRNIDGFNERVKKAAAKGEQLKRTVQTGFDRESGEPIYEEERLDLAPLPFIVVIIDEMADLMIVAGKEIEALVQRLAQMARAAGIHVIMATQRPSVDVITGTIKANFPTRISFQVTSKIDSRTILGEQGGEQLLGQGDMLFMAGGGRIRRVHGPFVSDTEVEEVVKHLKAQGHPEYVEAVTADPEDEDGGVASLLDGDDGGGSGDKLYDEACAVVLRDRKVSVSYIQRRLQVGYNRAARIIERMEEEGLVSAPNHQGKRDILAGEG